MGHGDERPRKKPKLSNQNDEINDYSKLETKADHPNLPLWVCPNGRVFMETFSACHKQAEDFLITIAEPVCRPEFIHEYNLTPHSLYAAVSAGLETETIIYQLNILSKTKLDKQLTNFIHAATANCGKVKLVLNNNRYFVESPFPEVLKTLVRDEVISNAVISSNAENGGQEFEIDPTKVEIVKQRCQNECVNYPMLEEYDFRNDHFNPDVGMKLRPEACAKTRPYQQHSLSKMFGNGRARSDIIVLPCGAGKSLVGVSAASQIGKSCLCLATNATSVDQWVDQFKLWSTVQDKQICRFKSDCKEEAARVLAYCKKNAIGVVVVTTYAMLGSNSNRSHQSHKIIEEIRNREWGLIVMDEVHVVPAKMFRNVIQLTKSHCKLGLTATLVREDDMIQDLHFLIGPKLYEANWMELAKRGYIANVECAEVKCDMTKEFLAEYMKEENSQSRKQALYLMNPNKFRTCEFLIKFHEEQRRDKIIVFSDNIFTLKEYATRLGKPMIYGETKQAETNIILHHFKTNQDLNTVFMSKVGDNSLDIPEANVIIQISSHGGSRRQEAQRLGRILRAKGGRVGNNAYFYSLVSVGTQESFYAAKRQRFLVDQGYSFKLLTSKELCLPKLGSGTLSYDSVDDQNALLLKVLSAGEGEIGAVDSLAEDLDGIDVDGKLKSNGKQKHGNGEIKKSKNNRHHLFRNR